MASLTWNSLGTRYYEGGVDRGTLYLDNGNGVAWNGLVNVSESPIGGTSTALYIDGVRYLNEVESEEFEGSIEAYTYPEEFMEYDGASFYQDGLYLEHQPRAEFSISYRTLVGNDTDGLDHGYKIHILYNLTAAPTSNSWGTVNDSFDANTFSWSVQARPEFFEGKAPTSHLVVDSTKISKALLYEIESILYGSKWTSPRLLTPEDLPILTNNSYLRIEPNYITGISGLFIDDYADLKGLVEEGIYSMTARSRIADTNQTGIYRLVN